MDKRMLLMLEQGDAASLQKELEALPNGELEELIKRHAVRGEGDLNALLRAIFLGSPCHSGDGVERRLKTYTCCAKLAESGDMENYVAVNMMGLLMMETDSLPGSCLAKLASMYVDSIKSGHVMNGRSLDLLPNILTSLGTREKITYGDGQLSGMEYKKQIINTLCSSRWDSQCVIHLTSMFRDVPLSQEELQFVMEKVLRLLPSLELQELPPLVYQLLLLAPKSHKKLALEGIVSFFKEQDLLHSNQKSAEDTTELEVAAVSTVPLRHVEGTIILHIVFAVKLDQDLGREFIKTLKVGQLGDVGRVLCPFNVALTLSLARIHRLEEQVFEMMKVAILKSFKDQQMQQSSALIKDLVSSQVWCVSDVILKTIQNSGWDHISQGLVQLGFTLMDSFGPKAGPGGKVAETGASVSRTPAQQACSLGARVLLETFKAHDVVRREILEQLLNRVVTKATVPITHYLELLSDMVTSAPLNLLECLPKVQEAFDYLSVLPSPVTKGLLQAILPLLRVRINLKDSLILALRKGMFSSQLEARKSSVIGYLLLLKNFKVLGSLASSQTLCSQGFSASQVKVEVHARLNPAANEALCLEILGSLRRCLIQQADVRLLLYEGFYDVLRRNSKLGSTILQMLLVQLKRCYEAGDVLPPVRLNGCITAQGEQVFLQEPLGHLLCCTVHCVMKWREIKAQAVGDDEDDEDDDDDGGGEGSSEYAGEGAQSCQRQLEAMLESMTRRMIKSDLDDFELDKSADFSLTTSVGVKNNIYVILVIGIYEVLMEYSFITGDPSRQKVEQVLGLFQRYLKLVEILREKSVKGKGGATSKTPRSLLSLRCVDLLLSALYRDESSDHEEMLAPLRGSVEFQRYVLTVVQQKVQQAEEIGHVDGPDGQDPDKVLRHLVSIARVLLWKYISVAVPTNDSSLLSSGVVEPVGKKDKHKGIPLLCLDVLQRVITAVNTRFSHKKESLYAALDLSREDQEDADNVIIAERAAFHMRQFQRSVVGQLSGGEEDLNMKELHGLVSLLLALSKELQPGSTEFEQCLNWTTKICKESKIEDLLLCKMLMNLLFSLHLAHKGPRSLLKDLAQDIHSQLGDIDEDVQVENQSIYAIVNSKTAPSVTLVVLSHAEHMLEDVEWLIARLRGELAYAKPVTSEEGTQDLGPRQAQERAAAVQLGALVTCCHELVQAALPAGSCSTNLLKLLTKMYSVLASITKYYLQVYTQNIGDLPGRFEKLVKLSGSHLTPQCYAMITYIQSVQSDSLNHGSDKKSKRGAAALASAAKAKVLRETRPIPNLIFYIEQYECFLIQLSKKSKVNLMEGMKPSTSRDFRINAATLQEALENQDSDNEDATQSGDGTQSTTISVQEKSQKPPSKKRKT
ncbi:Fanconi anemia group I protein [Lampetra fluviatilis]